MFQVFCNFHEKKNNNRDCSNKSVYSATEIKLAFNDPWCEFRSPNLVRWPANLLLNELCPKFPSQFYKIALTESE